jgi:rRNA-processing protein FCF1
LPKVTFDSSFLIAVIEHPTTWHEDITECIGSFEPIILDCVRAELEALSRGRGKRARHASLAGILAKGFRASGCGQASVDNEIVSFAKSNKAVVATVDRELIRTIRSLGLTGVTLRRGRVALV